MKQFNDLIKIYNDTLIYIKINDWKNLDEIMFTGHIITASNPRGIKKSHFTNFFNNKIFEIILNKNNINYYYCKGSNYENTWVEYGFAIEGISDKLAIKVGKKLNQIAIFKINNSKKTVLFC